MGSGQTASRAANRDHILSAGRFRDDHVTWVHSRIGGIGPAPVHDQLSERSAQVGVVCDLRGRRRM